jgi:carboxypeptidase family protein
MKSFHLLRTLISIFVVVFCFATFVSAQEITGAITGTVTDPNGAVVKGATVTITNSDTKLVVRTVNTGDDGQFSAPILPSGTYDIVVEAQGFKKHVDTGVKLQVNERRTVDVALETGSVNETVTVSSGQMQVDTQSATASNVVNGEQIRELSLNNRNWAQLILLSPGVSSNLQDQIYVGTTSPSGTSNALQIAVNGVRPNSNTYTVDGADTTDRGANLTVQTYPSVDAIKEFSLLRSLYPAESGRSSGGQVNVITKSGTSEFHGDLYEFWRNDKLNANAYLTNRDKPLGVDADGKSKRAPFRYHDFGGTIGGPLVFPRFGEGGPSVIKHHTFFFFSEEARRVIVYPTLSSTVPTAALRQGIFSQPVCIGPVANPCSTVLPAGTQLPLAQWSPLAAAYVQDVYNKLPLPSDSVGTLNFPTRGIFNFRQELIRIDHRFNDKLSAYYRFENDTIPTIEPGGLFNGTTANQPFVSTTQTSSPGRTHIARATWVPSASTVLEFGGSYSFGDVPSKIIGLINQTNSPDVTARTPGFAFPTTRGRIPDVAGNGFTGINGFGPYSDFSYNKSAFATLSKVFGTHTTKYGFNFARIRKHENSLGGVNEGSYGAVTSTPVICTTLPNTPAGCNRVSGTSTTNQLWANFLLGNFQTFTQNQFDLTADLRATDWEGFGQDEWRVKSNITFYYGARITRFGQPWDGNGRMTSFNPFVYSSAAGQAFQVTGNGNRVPGTGNPLNGIVVNSQVTVPGATVSPFGKAVAPTPTNIAPRIGIAWDPFKKGTTSVRMGYGLYYDQMSFSFYETGLVSQNPPFQQQIVINPTTLDNPLGGSTTVSNALQTVAGIDPNFKTPYVQHWSLDLQHQLNSKTLITVGYFGSKGTHLSGLVDLNTLPAGYALTKTCATNLTTGPATIPCQSPGQVFISGSATAAGSEIVLQQIKPYRGYNTVRYLETAFDSNYHALQIQAQRRFARTSQINLAYTWSRNMTDSQNEFSTVPQDTYNLKAEYARANLDRRQVLNVNYIYELPWFSEQKNFKEKVLGGWQFSGITVYYTGLGFSPATSSNDPAGLTTILSANAGSRPNMICDPNSNAPHTDLQWFNTGCFVNAVGTNLVGNAGRNTIDGPPTTRFDATLTKNIRFSEARSIQLRWEVFNVFNHTNFATISSLNITSSVYGRIGTTRDPRTMQLGAKFIF